MRPFAVLLSCWLALPAFAGSAVQILSRDCTVDGKVWTSSGLAFRDAGHTYAIGSASRVWRTDDRCQSIGYAGQTYPAHLVRADWGSDLALFEIATPLDVPQLAALKPATSGAVVLNVAAETLTGGRILTRFSRRHNLAAIGNAIELQGITIPIELVGAGAFNTDGGWVGLVSHGYIETIAGTTSRVRDWDEAAKQENHLVVVPASAILDWIRKAPSAAFETRLSDQRDGTPRVFGRGLALTLDCPYAPIGDGHGGPIGGSDGIGIGGDGFSSPACEAAVVTETSTARDGATASEQELLGGLTQGGEARARFFVRKAVTGEWQRTSFGSLGELVRGLEDPSLILIEKAPTTQVNAQLQAIGARLAELAQDSFRELLADGHYIPEEIGLLRKVYLAGRMLDSERALLLTADELRVLADPNGVNHWAWYNYSLATQHDRAVEEQAKLRQAADLL